MLESNRRARRGSDPQIRLGIAIYKIAGLATAQRARCSLKATCNLGESQVKVDKEKFDAVLKALLKATPIKRKDIKTSGKRGSKTPLFQKP